MIKEPINYNQLSHMANTTCPDLIRLRVVPAADGKWNCLEGVFRNSLKELESGFGRIVTSRNETKKYATLDSLRVDLLRACEPYHPEFVMRLEESE